MKHLFIERLHNGYTNWKIQAEGYPAWQYGFYSKREAIKLYRVLFGLVGKHFRIIEW